MELAEITKLAGANRKRKRVGRGHGSGSGKTSGRGHKGAGSRAGSKSNRVTEGGQMPIFRRLPKRGFSNAQFKTRYYVINVRDIEQRFDSGAHVTPSALIDAGLVRNKRFAVKVLGTGDITKKVTVEAAKFSKQAVEKIQAVGGEARVIAAAAG